MWPVKKVELLDETHLWVELLYLKDQRTNCGISVPQDIEYPETDPDTEPLPNNACRLCYYRQIKQIEQEQRHGTSS